MATVDINVSFARLEIGDVCYRLVIDIAAATTTSTTLHAPAGVAPSNIAFADRILKIAVFQSRQEVVRRSLKGCFLLLIFQ